MRCRYPCLVGRFLSRERRGQHLPRVPPAQAPCPQGGGPRASKGGPRGRLRKGIDSPRRRRRGKRIMEDSIFLGGHQLLWTDNNFYGQPLVWTTSFWNNMETLLGHVGPYFYQFVGMRNGGRNIICLFLKSAAL